MSNLKENSIKLLKQLTLILHSLTFSPHWLRLLRESTEVPKVARHVIANLGGRFFLTFPTFILPSFQEKFILADQSSLGLCSATSFTLLYPCLAHPYVTSESQNMEQREVMKRKITCNK